MAEDPPKKKSSAEELEDDEMPKIGMVIHHQEGRGSWMVLKNIASGPFSDVFIVANPENHHMQYAMKVERQHGNLRAVLKYDVIILSKMTEMHARGFPKMLGAGRTNSYKYLVMELLGPDLGRLRRSLKCKHFSLPTALRICMETIDRLEKLHSTGWLARDVKAPNFTIGTNPFCEEIYMLDFGFARKFREADGTLVKPREKAALVGTFQYAPLSSHHHQEQAPKDDMESWFYMAIEIIKGPLPWGHFKEYKDMETYKEAIRGEKRKEFLDGISREFDDILTSIDNTKFFELPDYDFFRRQIYAIANRKNIDLEAPYDWQRDPEIARRAPFVGDLGESNEVSARLAVHRKSKLSDKEVVMVPTPPSTPPDVALSPAATSETNTFPTKTPPKDAKQDEGTAKESNQGAKA